MSFKLILFLLNFSIAIPAFLVLFKINFAIRCYLFFILYLWAGFLNDTVSYAFIIKTQSNLLNSNIYTLLAWFITLAQFAVWNRKPVSHYLAFAVPGLLVWLFDNVYLNNISDNNSIFRLFFSLVIVLFSLDQFNKIIIYEKAPLSRNPIFLICTAFILFFGSKAFLESFNLFHVGLSDLFFRKLFLILSVVNLLANLLYTYAILCIPRKQEFTLPY